MPKRDSVFWIFIVSASPLANPIARLLNGLYVILHFVVCSKVTLVHHQSPAGSFSFGQRTNKSVVIVMGVIIPG